MDIVLYRTVDNNNVVNKTLIDEIIIENVRLKQPTNILRPTIVISSLEPFNLNYAKIPDFNRYYFISDITIHSNGIYVLGLEVDVLMTYKEGILDSYAEYERGIKEGEYLGISTPTDLRKDIDIFESDVTLTGNKNIIFSSIGGVD